MTDVAAPISAVTVYTNRARVTRRGITHLASGLQTLVIEGVPSTIEQDSLRASGRGAGVKILGVDIVTRFLAETPDIDTKELTQQLDALRDKDRAFVDDEAQQTELLELCKTLRENSGVRFAKALATGKANIDTLRPVTQYLADEYKEISARLREINGIRRELGKQIDVLEKQLRQMTSTAARQRRDISIEVEVTAETDFELQVVYMLAGCHWQPNYDIRLHIAEVELTYLALVTQESGEDWSNVELSLSTARPVVSAGLPNLSPWYIDKSAPAPPHAPMARQSLMAAAPAAMPDMMRMEPSLAAKPMMPVAEVLEAEVETSGAAVTYRVMRLSTIPSDSSPHKTQVTTLKLPVSLDYVVVAKLATETYLRARITNNTTYMLLPGKAQIFHDEEFVGNMRIARVVAPNEVFEAQLGLEDRIKVERELLERTTTKMLVGNTRRVAIGYRLKLNNNMTTAAHVVVFDQLPVALHEDIKVKLLDAQPKPSEQNEKNILKWELDLAPQSKREIVFTFQLEYPRDMTVTGLGNLDVSQD